MTKIYIPAQSADDWRQLLVEPDKQWKTGYSARSLAYCWQEANGFPEEVKQLFRQSQLSPFQNVELLLAIPEHKTPLRGGSRPSQTDLLVLARNSDRSGDSHLTG